MAEKRIELFDEWTTYEKVVAGDYMHHRQFFAEVVASCRKLSGPLDILDLGCGDAVPVLPLLEQLELGSYTGVDPASGALALAEQNLAHLQSPITLVEGSMESVLPGLDGPFDLILMSFSLHHLHTRDKRSILSGCRARLKSSGIVAIIDVFRQDGESRGMWLDRWEKDARQRFSVLSAGEVSRLVTHVRENDLPETFTDFAEIAHNAGFARSETLMQGPEQLNGVVVCCAQ